MAPAVQCPRCRGPRLEPLNAGGSFGGKSVAFEAVDNELRGLQCSWAELCRLPLSVCTDRYFV